MKLHKVIKGAESVILMFLIRMGIILAISILILVVVSVGIFIWEKVTGKTYGEDEEQAYNMAETIDYTVLLPADNNIKFIDLV